MSGSLSPIFQQKDTGNVQESASYIQIRIHVFMYQNSTERTEERKSCPHPASGHVVWCWLCVACGRLIRGPMCTSYMFNVNGNHIFQPEILHRRLLLAQCCDSRYRPRRICQGMPQAKALPWNRVGCRMLGEAGWLVGWLVLCDDNNASSA